VSFGAGGRWLLLGVGGVSARQVQSLPAAYFCEVCMLCVWLLVCLLFLVCLLLGDFIVAAAPDLFLFLTSPVPHSSLPTLCRSPSSTRYP
jgi:hypothetical protein